MGPNSMSSVFIKGEGHSGTEPAQTHRGKKMRGDRGRDWSDAATNHEHRIASNHQKLGREQKDFSLDSSEETCLCSHLDSRF